jgi:hypothetical protein
VVVHLEWLSEACVCEAIVLEGRQQVFVRTDENDRRQWRPLAIEELRQRIAVHPG